MWINALYFSISKTKKLCIKEKKIVFHYLKPFCIAWLQRKLYNGVLTLRRCILLSSHRTRTKLLIKFHRPIVNSRPTLFDALCSSRATVIMEDITYGNGANFAKRALPHETYLKQRKTKSWICDYLLLQLDIPLLQLMTHSKTYISHNKYKIRKCIIYVIKNHFLFCYL